MSPRAIIAEVFVRLLYPLLLLASIWITLRGHNSPGGGFIGGLVAVAASASYALTFDVPSALRKLPLLPRRLCAFGVGIAMLSSVPAVFLDLPFLTHVRIIFPLGLWDLPVSTAMIFDLGVYLCVWGALGGYCLVAIMPAEEGR